MSDSKLSLKDVVRNLAKKQQLSGLSTADFRKRTTAALSGAGFSKTRAKIISQGIQSGTSKLTPKQAEKVIHTMVKGKVIKPIGDVKGMMNRFVANQKKQAEAKDDKGRLRERMKRENLRRRADETIKEMKEEREVGKKEYSSVKEKQSASINYGGSGAIKKTTGPAFSADFQNLPSDFEAPAAIKISPQEVNQEKPDEEVQALVKEAEQHDLPID